MIIPVAAPFQRYAETALARLRYLYPTANFALTPAGIEIEGGAGIPKHALAREVQYALYREKIYGETLPMRRALI